MSFYTIFKAILGFAMTVAIIYWCKLYSNLGKASVIYDKKVKKIIKKSDLQKAKITFLVILVFAISITCIIDFLAK